MAASTDCRPFLARNEFLIRRLHSLTGLIPIGAFMAIHLATNASVLDGPATFQRAVYQIHALGRLLPVVEWVFIFLPILFHGLFGLVIIRGGSINVGSYPLAGNVRYVLQRVTGVIALVFILGHVLHLHGWFHDAWWLRQVVEPLGGGRFHPFHAASTLGAAMQQGMVVPALYAIGLLACVYHLANGLWTMGITWGVWTGPRAQRRASRVCAAFGVALGVLAMSALYGAMTVDTRQAVEIEDSLYEAKVTAHEIAPRERKRTGAAGVWPGGSRIE